MARIIVPNGLVGYYPLDGDTFDRSGRNNHGTLVNGVGYRPGKFRHGVGFNGSTNYVDCGATLGAIVPPLTYATWVYFSEAPAWGDNVFPRIISTFGQSGSYWYGSELLLAQATGFSGVAGYGIYFQAGTGGTDVPVRGSTIGITQPGWYHLAATATAGSPTIPLIYINGIDVSSTNAFSLGPYAAVTGLWNMRIGNLPGYAGADYFARSTMVIDDARIYNRVLSPGEVLELAAQRITPRRIWVELGAASGGGGTDAAIAGTQDSDVGAITAEATTAAAIAGTQDADVGAIAAEATTGAAIAGAQAPDVGAITAEATTGAAIVGTQDSDVAALEVTAGTGSTDAAMAGTQAPDVGAITVEATLGLTLSATQASDVGYIVVEATLPASMAGTQDSDVAAITVTAAGTSIWTDISGSTTSWADQSAASTIWTDL